MKILVDMNLPPKVADLLISHGIDAKHWYTIGAPNAKDSEIFSYSFQNEYIVVTCDLDFSALFSASGRQKPSVIQVRIQCVDPEEIATLVALAAKQNIEELKKGAILSIDTKRTRLKLLPLGGQNSPIRPLSADYLPEYAEVIRKSFATVAKELNFTRQNCPSHTSFVTNEQLAEKINSSYYPLGYFTDEKLVGFVSLEDRGNGVYKLKNLAILPEYRHCGYGKSLLDFCKEKVKILGGNKITIGIIEECTILKNWYTANGFIHTGTDVIKTLPFTVGYLEWRSK